MRHFSERLLVSKILLTGSSGFVGRRILQTLIEHDRDVRILTRTKYAGRVDSLVIPENWHIANFSQTLSGIAVVVHAAARVHVMSEKVTNSLDEYRRVNVEATLHLAQQAAETGVRRFVFLSSAKVNGETTLSQRAFRPDDVPAPQDAYGVSKMEAEQGLRQISANTEMEVVIIRPPLIYGPAVKANFASMMHWVRRGLPLPLGNINNNQRSFVGLDNLVDLVITCLQHPSAANQTFMVSDGEDLSTAELLRRLGIALGRPAKLVNIPPFFLKTAAMLANKSGVYGRLSGSFALDITKTTSLLGWSPPVTVNEGLIRATEGLSK